MLSSDSDDGAKVKEDMAAMSRKKLLAREAERLNDANSKETSQVIPKDEDISGGDLSEMEEDDLNMSKKEQANDDEDAASEKKGRSLKDKKSRSYRGKAADAEAADSDDMSSLRKDDGKSKKNKSGTKELPLRYREDNDHSVKRGRHSDHPTSSPPPSFDRHQQKRYASSPHRHGRRPSRGSLSPQHRRYRQQDTLSKPYRGGGYSYNSWQRSKSPRQQRGRWGSTSPNRAHSPGDKRHQTEDDQGSWKGTRYSSQRARPDKRKTTDQDSHESKRRRTEAGGPRSPSATPPPPPDMEEPRPQQPSEPPPTQPDPPLPSEGSFMPSTKELAKESVTVAPSVTGNVTGDDIVMSLL